MARIYDSVNPCHFATIWRVQMLTYKVLLVDDEEEVMDVIEHRICWKQMGFEVVGKA